jgi:hypothetical protein
MAKTASETTVVDAGTRMSELKEALRPFLDANPSAVLVAEKSLKRAKKRIRIERPWNDDSLSIMIPPDSESLVQDLNHIYLPPRFRGIWHTDTQDLEIAWTPMNLRAHQREISDRKFVFSHNGGSFHCEFGDSSNRLLSIAKNISPLTVSSSNFRNLLEFRTYIEMDQDERKMYGFDAARSFWIRDVKWDEENIIDIARSLNFYLTYFDNRSPQILIEDPPEESKTIIKISRYINGEFPKNIESCNLDEVLLSFWNSAYVSQPILSFMLYYRVIEYASSNYADNKARAALRKFLMSPNLKHDINNSVSCVIALLPGRTNDETMRISNLIKDTVSPNLLWKEISGNVNLFNKMTKFDGGFELAPLIIANETEENFKKRGMEAFCAAVRRIRNALSHGKDQETQGVITPSSANIRKLAPWVHLLAIVAGEVILYRDAG